MNHRDCTNTVVDEKRLKEEKEKLIEDRSFKFSLALVCVRPMSCVRKHISSGSVMLYALVRRSLHKLLLWLKEKRAAFAIFPLIPFWFSSAVRWT